MIGITGGHGILGTILVKKNLGESSASLFDGDVRDTEALYNWLDGNNIDQVIFLASKVAVKEVDANKDLAYDVNVNGIVQTIKAIKKLNREIYFFYSSTSHIYKSSDLPISEGNPIEPQNTYGLTKYLAECLLLDYAKSNPLFRLCIGRIFSFYHESQSPPYLYPTIRKRLATEDLSTPFKLFGANSERDFLNAEDVCTIIERMVNRKIEGVYNIGSGTSIKIKDFVQGLTPVPLNLDYDSNEKISILVANISKLKSVLDGL